MKGLISHPRVYMVGFSLMSIFISLFMASPSYAGPMMPHPMPTAGVSVRVQPAHSMMVISDVSSTTRESNYGSKLYGVGQKAHLRKTQKAFKMGSHRLPTLYSQPSSRKVQANSDSDELKRAAALQGCAREINFSLKNQDKATYVEAVCSAAEVAADTKIEYNHIQTAIRNQLHKRVRETIQKCHKSDTSEPFAFSEAVSHIGWTPKAQLKSGLGILITEATLKDRQPFTVGVDEKAYRSLEKDGVLASDRVQAAGDKMDAETTYIVSLEDVKAMVTEAYKKKGFFN